MVDLITETMKAMCNECDEVCGGKCMEYEWTQTYIEEGIKQWLSSFDMDSATKCFEAVNILKMKIVQEEMHEADERLLNSDWGEMEVQE